MHEKFFSAFDNFQNYRWKSYLESKFDKLNINSYHIEMNEAIIGNIMSFWQNVTGDCNREWHLASMIYFKKKY